MNCRHHDNCDKKNGKCEPLNDSSEIKSASVSGFSLKSMAVGVILFCLAGVGIYFALKGNSSGASAVETYNLDEYRKTDKALILYSELQSNPSGLKEPTCIALGPDNSIYAGGDRKIRVFDMDGKEMRQFNLQAQPFAMAVAENNDIFVSFGARVSVLNPNGTETKSWEFELGSIITSIAVSGQLVFMADAGKRVVHVKDLSGPEKEERKIGAIDKKSGDDGIVVYSAYFDVAVGDNDLITVVDPGRHRIKLYSQAGELISAWKSNPATGIGGFSGCCNPSHIALCPDGRIATSEKGIPRIKLYSPAGDFIGVVAGPESFKAGQLPCDIAVDKKGRVCALDPATGRIRIFVEK
jgi:sugar lactone lactonase YvrE